MTPFHRALALAALLPCSALAATPVLSGLYAVGEVGLVDFTTQDGKVTGRLKLSGACSFSGDTQVVTGAFEGNVLVAQVLLCQEGASCPAERTYPMLGFWRDDVVAGQVRLEPACSSPALDGKALFIRPASVEEKQKVLGGQGSAAQHAQKQHHGDPVVMASEAIASGKQHLEQQNYGQAREAFKVSVELDPRWEAYNGLGVSEVKLNRARASLEAFDKALELAAKAKVGTDGVQEIHYNRACALAALGETKNAVAALRTALKVGGAASLVPALAKDPDLEPIRGDAEFKKLYADAIVQSNRKKPR